MALNNIDLFKQSLLMLGEIDMRDTPSAEKAEVCLTTYGPLIRSLPGWTQWNEVEINQDYTAGDDERITVIGDVSVTLTLPQLVLIQPYIAFESDGFTVKNGEFYKAPRDGSRVQIMAQQGGDRASFAYRADTGQWVETTDIALTDAVPLNEAVHEHLAVMLAVRVAPKFGAAVSGELGVQYREAQAAMSATYGNRFKVKSTVDAEFDEGRWM